MSLNLTYRTYAAFRTAARRSGFTQLGAGKSLADWIRNQMGHYLYRVTGRGRRVPAMVHGFRMYLPDHPPLNLLLDQYENATTRLIESLLRPGMTFVDVGAHAGYFTLLAAGLVGASGKVYAFEPAPQNFALLKRNVELNGFQNVVMFQKAVADRVGKIELFLSRCESGWHSIYRGVKGAGRPVDIEVTTLDETLAREGWPSVDLLKIDAEGAEPAVLRGLQVLLRRSPSVCVIMEINPSTLQAAGVQPETLLAELENLGFSARALENLNFVATRNLEGPLRAADSSSQHVNS